MLGVTYPVVQAPITYIARAALAAAVSETGGLGVIETLTEEGRADLLRARDLTDRPVGANLMIQGWKRDPSIVDVLVEANVRHVFTSAGDPGLFTARLHDAGMTVVHVVGSLNGARKAVDAGVDALVVEGVQMGTRMLASREAAVHANFKDAIVAADDGGTILLNLPGNPTMRVLHVGLARRVAIEGAEAPLISGVTQLYFEGDMEASVANTGQVSSRILEVLPVADIIRSTWVDAQTALTDAAARF